MQLSPVALSSELDAFLRRSIWTCDFRARLYICGAQRPAIWELVNEILSVSTGRRCTILVTCHEATQFLRLAAKC
jgi:hypothetical protein